MKVLVLSGSNHQFGSSASVIHGFLNSADDLDVTLDDQKDILASPAMNEFDVCVFGTGFIRTVRESDGTLKREPDLSPAQEDGLFDFVAGGKGLVGVHGTGWWIHSRAVDLIGGHANWHPPGLTFKVQIEDTEHPVTHGLGDFEVEDEIYMSAWDPSIHILATAEWSDKDHPMAWVKPYKAGRVFYTTLGHTSDTFERQAMQTLMTQGVRWAGSRGEN